MNKQNIFQRRDIKQGLGYNETGKFGKKKKIKKL
jgi:hypothetical protein